RHAYCIVPQFKLKIDAAEKVIGPRVIGTLRDGGIENAQGFVGSARLEQRRSFGVGRGKSDTHTQKESSNPAGNPQRSTTFTSMPLRSGCALIAPSATSVPSVMPFTTSTRVRLERPVCTSCASILSSAIL